MLSLAKHLPFIFQLQFSVVVLCGPTWVLCTPRPAAGRIFFLASIEAEPGSPSQREWLEVFPAQLRASGRGSAHSFGLALSLPPLEKNVPQLAPQFSPKEQMEIVAVQKTCSSCLTKMTKTDEQSMCLLCLGETHNIAACTFCQQFTLKTRVFPC